MTGSFCLYENLDKLEKLSHRAIASTIGSFKRSEPSTVENILEKVEVGSLFVVDSSLNYLRNASLYEL